jgi:hypothetical protein
MMGRVDIFYVYRRNGAALTQIHYTCSTLDGAKRTIEATITIECYEEEADQIYAIAQGERAYRIERRLLNPEYRAETSQP